MRRRIEICPNHPNGKLPSSRVMNTEAREYLQCVGSSGREPSFPTCTCTLGGPVRLGYSNGSYPVDEARSVWSVADRRGEECTRADLTSAIASHSMIRARIKFEHVMIHATKQGMAYWSSMNQIAVARKYRRLQCTRRHKRPLNATRTGRLCCL